jgi:stress-induced-phosphoprotein 1
MRSNRSGAYAAMKNYDLALQDAEKCVALNGAFVKGYSRKGLALFNLGQVAAAKETYQKGACTSYHCLDDIISCQT